MFLITASLERCPLQENMVFKLAVINTNMKKITGKP